MNLAVARFWYEGNAFCLLGAGRPDFERREWHKGLAALQAARGTSTELAAVSSATRTPGDYALVWDGSDGDGTRVPVGQYFVCIEAAREHGPYSLIRQAVDIGSDAFTTDLPSDGELSGASADYRLA